MSAIHVSDQDFEEKVIKSKMPVMVDFFAEWCGPCKMAAPIVDELADEYKDQVSIVKLDVDRDSNTAGKYGVMSIPTVIMFKDGREVDRQVGFGGKSAFETMIKKVLG